MFGRDKKKNLLARIEELENQIRKLNDCHDVTVRLVAKERIERIREVSRVETIAKKPSK